METSNGSVGGPDDSTVPEESSTADATSSKRHQDDLRRLLEDPESYPHKPKTVRLIQTHASYVAIAPPFVYKVNPDGTLGWASQLGADGGARGYNIAVDSNGYVYTTGYFAGS